MTLRRKLIYLHSVFAAFAVVAAAATIYGAQVHVQVAINSLTQLVDQLNLVDRLRVDAQSELVQLHQIVDRRREVSASYLARRDAFFTQLEEAARFAAGRQESSNWGTIAELAAALRDETARCLGLVKESDFTGAEVMLGAQIESPLFAELDARLHNVRISLDDARRRSVNRVLVSNDQLFSLAAVIVASCAVLLVIASTMIRRWLIGPITQLHSAANEFGNGNLSYRVAFRSSDELGTRGSALNDMASSLAVSQMKYKSLFENLHDAVVICDSVGSVVECHDSDTQVLGVAAGDAVGRHVLENWPQWRQAAMDWNLVVACVAATGAQQRAVDLELPLADGKSAVVDVVTYAVEYGDSRYAAIVLRDVSERHRLQRLSRRAETMEATVTFSQGIAHDFKNLLNSAVTTLSLMDQAKTDARDRERLQTALRACQHAASLSRRLMTFASSDEGNPELIDLGEMVELILGSLDEVFLAPMDVQTNLERSVTVCVDRDHLTRAILNLVRNAGDAMPGGGDLRISTGWVTTANPITRRAPSLHAVLTVADTGYGMTDEVKERLFEPLFTTKERGLRSGRGMGLAVTYGAVRNADGFIQVDSEVGVGTTFRVYLPEGSGVAPLIESPAADTTGAAESQSL